MNTHDLLASPAIDYGAREERLSRFRGDEGEAMTQSEIQGDIITYACQSLKRLTENQPVPWLIRYEAFLFYSQQNPSLQVGPDILLAKGVALPGDVHYRIWEAGIPDLILEVASSSTWRDDSGWKKELYQTIGVPEYWQFDPQGHFLQDPEGVFATPRLQGWILRDDSYHPLPCEEKPESIQTYSPVLETVWAFRPGDKGSELRLQDPQTHTWFRTVAEEVEARQQAEVRASKAEAEVKRLRDLLKN